MAELFSLLRAEWLKMRTTKAFRVCLILMLVLAPLLSWLEGRQFAGVGLDATPETFPGLIEPIDPLEYLGQSGTDVTMMVLVILAGILGANEFQDHSLRTSLLGCSSRAKLLCSKLAAFGLFSSLVSLLSAYLCHMVMHLALGQEGLNPLLLNQAAWGHLLWRTLALTLLAYLSFLLGLLARTMLVPLIFLVPQIYNLGTYLTEHTSWGRYLPEPATELFVAGPYSIYQEQPLLGVLILALWLGAALILLCFRFVKTDLGGRY